jgi:hypothetical protein
VLHTRSETEYRAGTAAAFLPTIAAVDNFADEASERRRRLSAEQVLDQVLADSFPASDPPSWNPGTALLNPRIGSVNAKRSEAFAGIGRRRRASEIIDVPRRSGADRRFLHSLVSLAGAAVIALLVPFVILLVGLPIVLSVRGVLELIGWLFGVSIG